MVRRQETPLEATGRQWQAQEVPQPAAGVSPPEDAEVVLSLVVAAAVLAAAAPVAPAAAVVLAWLPPRKSVTYQPEPLSWKPAAVSCFLNVSAPHAGQAVSGASDIFCKTSLAWPQDSQR
jgi:hypothetical protein